MIAAYARGAFLIDPALRTCVECWADPGMKADPGAGFITEKKTLN